MIKPLLIGDDLFTAYKASEASFLTSKPSSYGWDEGLNYLTQFKYNRLNQVEQEIKGNPDPAKNSYDYLITNYEYDGFGNKIKITDTKGNITNYTYNNIGKLTEVKEKVNGIEQSTKYWYDYNGNLVKIKDARGLITRYKYNELGWLLEKMSSNGAVTSYQYDAAGRLKQTIDPAKTTVDYNYRADNTTKNVTYTASNVSTNPLFPQIKKQLFEYEYDQAGNKTLGKVSQAYPTDSAPVLIGSSTYVPDRLNRITSITKNFAGFSSTTGYGYDASGNLASMTYPNSAQTLFYDLNSEEQLQKIRIGTTQVVKEFSYWLDGRVQKINYDDKLVTSNNISTRNGLVDSISTTLTDALGKKTDIVKLTYQYDGEGNLVKRNGVEDYTYDELNRLTTFTSKWGGLQDEQRVNWGIAQEDYLGQKSLELAVSDTYKCSIDYDSSSIGLSLPNITADITAIKLTPLNSANRVVQRMLDVYYSDDNCSFTKLAREKWQYTKDTSGTITITFKTSITAKVIKVHCPIDDRNSNLAPVSKVTFSNKLNELFKVYVNGSVIEATYNDQNGSLTQTTYTYDQVGNRLTEHTNLLNVVDKIYTYYSNTNWLKTSGKFAYKYDANGNLVEKGNKYTVSGDIVTITTSGTDVEYWQYCYDLLNRLIRVIRNGKIVADYVYDENGLRVATTYSDRLDQTKKKTINFVYDQQGQVIYEKSSAWAQSSYIYANGKLFAKVEGVIGSGAKVLYYHNDNQGSPRALTDNTGAVVWNQDYLPFGQPVGESTQGGDTRLTYTGKDLDEKTGLYYYNARWYDADTGRFTTEDTVVGDLNKPQDLNWYSYVMNNPLRYTDPTGHNPYNPDDDWTYTRYNVNYSVWDLMGEGMDRRGRQIVTGVFYAGTGWYFYPEQYKKDAKDFAKNAAINLITPAPIQAYKLYKGIKGAVKENFIDVDSDTFWQNVGGVGADGLVTVGTGYLGDATYGSVLGVFEKCKDGKMLSVLANDRGSVGLYLFAGKEEMGAYGLVGGHHIHAKAGFKGNVLYDSDKGFSISQNFMEKMDWNHQAMTSEQRRLFKELNESGRANTLGEHSRIAIQSLMAGGASYEEALDLVGRSLANLYDQGVLKPTRIPWYTK